MVASTAANSPAPQALTPKQRGELDALFARAAAAQALTQGYDQQRIDRLCRAVCWAVSNTQTFRRLVDQGIREGGYGDPLTRMDRRLGLHAILRDLLRQKSVGILEEIPAKGLVQYARPVGVVGSIVPAATPVLTPAGQGLFAVKARDAIIFSPHPHTKDTTYETCAVMRRALRELDAPEDLIQCIPHPSPAAAEALCRRADLPIPAADAADAAMIFDETADVIDACHNTMLSKTTDFGAGDAADGNLIVHESIFNAVIKQLEVEGGYQANEEQKELLRRTLWNRDGHRLLAALPAPQLAEAAGFTIPGDRKFLFVLGGEIAPENPWRQSKQTTLLALFLYKGAFENALDAMRVLLGAGKWGRSVGIYSYNDEHIHRLGFAAPAARVLVRQPQSRANAHPHIGGSLCLRHYLNTTWVSRPLPANMPPPEELFGEFYDSGLD